MFLYIFWCVCTFILGGGYILRRRGAGLECSPMFSLINIIQQTWRRAGSFVPTAMYENSIQSTFLPSALSVLAFSILCLYIVVLHCGFSFAFSWRIMLFDHLYLYYVPIWIHSCHAFVHLQCTGWCFLIVNL